jgi:hypothetical protein
MTNEEKESNVHNKMIQYAEELAKDPKYAINAIRSRNLTIKALRAEIDHRIVTAHEMKDRLDELAHDKEELLKSKAEIESLLQEELLKVKKISEEKDKLKEYVNQFENALIVIRTELRTKEEFEKRGWTYNVKRLIDKLPQWSIVGPILGFLLTPPASKYFLIFLFVLMFIASFIGWPAVASTIEPIIKLFGG